MRVVIFAFLIATAICGQKKGRHRKSGNEIDYDDYGEDVLKAEEFGRKNNTETDEVKSSSEEDYDDEAWRKKSSREELIQDINSLEKEVNGKRKDGNSTNKDVSSKEKDANIMLPGFSLPKIKTHIISGSIGHEILKKYSWIREIDPIVRSEARNLIFETASFKGRRETLVLRTGHEYEYGRYYPMDNDGIYNPNEYLTLNYIQGSTVCQQTRAYRGTYLCIKSLDATMRVLGDLGPAMTHWDKLCLQVYLPVWKYGYEFCYGVYRDNPDAIYAQDRIRNKNHRKMRTFVFNGGTYDNWIPMYIQDNN